LRFFEANSNQLLEKIESGPTHFAKEDAIFSDNKLNEFALTHSLRLMSLDESRNRIRASILPFYYVLSAVALILAELLCNCFVKAMDANWNGSDTWVQIMRWAHRLSIASVPILMSAFVVLALPILDLTGSQAYGEREWVLARPFDPYRYDFWDMSRLDSHNMFVHLLKNAETLSAGNHILVLTGWSHTRDFQGFFLEKKIGSGCPASS
jgi:hypothetical protein